MKRNLLPLSLCLILLAGCHGAPQLNGEQDHEAEEHHESGEISIPPQNAILAGISSQTILPASFQGAIPCSGRILSSWNTQQVLTAPASGTVHLARPLTQGMDVASGTVLLSISGEGVNGGDAAEMARITLEKAEADFKRTSALYQERLTTEAEYQASLETVRKARKQSDALGGSLRGTVMRAPRTGYLVCLDVTEGDYVNQGQHVATVASSGKLLLEADLPGRYLQDLSQVSGADIRPESSQAYLSSEHLNARLLSASRVLSGGYVTVTFELDNLPELSPGAFCQVYLRTASRDSVISLPRQALTEEQGVRFVYRQLDEDCYEKVAVTTGQENGSSVEILSGIRSGDRIVTEGAVRVRLAGAASQIPAHSHHH